MSETNKMNYSAPEGLWGIAVKYTRIDDDGKMWVGNDEYETQVNYCPMTGQPAPKQMTGRDSEFTYEGEVHKYKIYNNE